MITISRYEFLIKEPKLINLCLNFQHRDVPALQCDGCDKWMHASCIPGMTTELYDTLAADVSGQWHCPACSDTFKVPAMRLTRQNGTWKVSQSEPTATRPERKPFRNRKRLPNDIKTVVLNANSLKGKKHQLNAMIESTKPHIIIATETKLPKRFKTSELFDSSQYSVFRKDRNAKGGGVLVAISNELDGYDIDLKLETESVYVLLHGKNQSPTLVGAIYRPPDHKYEYLNNVLKELRKVIELNKPGHILIGGDFNLPNIIWEERRVPPSTPHRKQAKLLLDTMNELTLEQVVDIPTRGTNTLDLLFTDTPSLVSKVSAAPGLSDHDTIIVEHQLKATINKKKDREVPLYNKADWDGLRKHIKMLASDYMHANPPDDCRSCTTTGCGSRAPSTEQ